MLPHAGSLELRLADLEAHLDRLSSTLQEGDGTGPASLAVEQQLVDLARRCSDILKQWAATSERHARAASELEAKLSSWDDVATGLQRDATNRFQDLERLIEHEWASLRRLHEQPIKQLRDQAESLTEICVSTAGSTQTGIERTEARLALLERDLHRRMDDLSRDVHAVLDELRQQNGAASRGPSNSWALEEVARLHSDIRDGAATAIAVRTVSGPTQSAEDLRPGRPAQSFDADRRPLSVEPERSPRFDRQRFAAIAGVAAAILIAGGISMMFYNRARLAADQAGAARQRADAIATAANDRIDAARRDAAAQIEAARGAASRAQITGDVLAAPDLMRFNLIGADGRASAQLLFSRTRGIVFSGSRLSPPGPGSVYQVWLLTTADPVSAGTIAPDDSGRASLAMDRPPDIPRPILGARVTLEPAPGRQTPSEQSVLFRAQ